MFPGRRRERGNRHRPQRRDACQAAGPSPLSPASMTASRRLPLPRRWRALLALAAAAALALHVALGWRGAEPQALAALPSAAGEAPAAVLEQVQALESAAAPERNRPNADPRLLEAARRLLALAEAGDPRAQWRLGWYYLNGWGPERDRCSATLWLERAARQDHPAAQYWLAVALLPPNGQGVVADPVAAFLWASLARAQDYTPAERNAHFFERDLTPAQRAAGEAALAAFDPAAAPALEIRRYPYVPVLVGVWPRLTDDVMPCRQARARYDDPGK